MSFDACEKVRYVELTPREFRARIKAAPIAYLPLGTLEWHGEHLPLGSDGLQSSGVMELLAHKAGGIVLPMLFLGPDLNESVNGTDFYGMDIYGFRDQSPTQLDGSAYWVPDDLFISLLRAILARLKRAGFRIVVAHGHGPSNHCFKQYKAEWEKEFGLSLFHMWRDDESDGMGIQTDHAAANETSIMMHLHPETVKMDQLHSDPAVWPVAVSGDDPRVHASAQKGRRIVGQQTERMCKLLGQALITL
ncbi:MAG: creatininase family protein [Oscillospiraceae bacterium]|jgi:creatinine amidohydrolase|nr:creatininase family protein [Oscillospiraceae bacterium]